MKLPSSAFAQGVMAMMLSNVFYSLMAILIRLDPSTNALEAAFYRFAVGIAVVASLALIGRVHLKFSNFKDLFWRGLIGGVSVVLFYLPINSIGLGKTSLLQYSYPIFALFFSALWLKEKITPAILSITGLAVAGLVLLNLPSLLDGKWNWMFLSALASGICSGAAVTLVKKLTATEGSSAIFLAQSLGGFWIILIPANLSPLPGGWLPAMILLGVGITAAAGQLLMTWSYRQIDASTGSLMGTLVPLLNIGAGVLLFQEKFTWLEACGGLLTLAACLTIILIKNKERKAFIQKGARTPLPEAKE